MCVREVEREYTVYVKECYDCYEINALKEYTVPSVLYQRAGKSVIYERKKIARQYALSGYDLIWRPQEAELRSRSQNSTCFNYGINYELLKKSLLDERTKRREQLQYLKSSDTVAASKQYSGADPEGGDRG